MEQYSALNFLMFLENCNSLFVLPHTGVILAITKSGTVENKATEELNEHLKKTQELLEQSALLKRKSKELGEKLSSINERTKEVLHPDEKRDEEI